MAKQSATREKQQKGMLKSIGGRDDAESDAETAGEAAPDKAAGIGWIGYVGGLLWALVFCAAGVVGWLIFANG